LSDLQDSYFVQTLFSPTGRFSFYGPPTDIKIKNSFMSTTTDNNNNINRYNYKILDVTFSTLSQATQTEIPRVARIIATLPTGSNQAVMLVGSASAARWKKGSDRAIASTIDSFQAIAAPPTELKMRAQRK
jgi:hypothetical protein